MRGLKGLTLILLAALLVVGLPVSADDGQTRTVLGGSFHLETGEHLNHDLMVFGGTVTLDAGSTVDGDVTVLGGHTTVAGEVYGDLVAVGGVVELADSAVVDGDLVAFGTVRRVAGSRINGNLVEGLEALSRIPDMELRAEPAAPIAPIQPQSPIQPQVPVRPVVPAPADTLRQDAANVGRGVGGLVIALILAVAVAVLLPQSLERTVRVIRDNWALSLGVGALTLTAAGLLTVVFALLVLVCVGLPLLFVLGVAVLVACAVGWAAVGRLVGEKIAQAARLNNTNAVSETALGTAAITLAAMIPCVGAIAGLAALCWGLGATVLAHVSVLQGLQTNYRGPRQWPTPPAGPAGPAPRKGDTTRLTDRGFPQGETPGESPSPAGS